MKIFRAYQKTKFFLAVNIAGLAVGLAAAIMLILFVVNEYSYDRHFANADRIVSLNTVLEGEGVNPISLRTFTGISFFNNLPFSLLNSS